MLLLRRIPKFWSNLAGQELLIIILANTANTTVAGDTSTEESNLTTAGIIHAYKGPVASSTYIVAASYLGFVTFVGTSFNIVVIFVILTDNKLRTPMNAILLNQAFADFGIAFFGNPVAFYNAVHGDWMLGQTYCIIYGFLMSLFGIGSIFNLSVLAYQRYNIICHPFTGTSNLSWPKAMICIGVTWLCSGMSSIPPLLGWGSYQQEAANISCSVDWQSRDLNSSSYIAFLFAFALFLPLFVIGFSYYNILRTIKYVNMMKTVRNMGTVSKAETRVAFMVLLMVCAFSLAWGPYAVFSLIIAFTDYSLSPTVSIAPSLFAKSSVCYNPIIYFYLNSEFRKSWLSRLGRRDQDDVSNDVRHIQLSKMKSPDARAPNDNQPQAMGNGEVQRNTITSNLSSSESQANLYTQSRKRDFKLSELIPYNTLPFFRRKFNLRTRSLPNII